MQLLAQIYRPGSVIPKIRNGILGSPGVEIPGSWAVLISGFTQLVRQDIDVVCLGIPELSSFDEAMRKAELGGFMERPPRRIFCWSRLILWSTSALRYSKVNIFSFSVRGGNFGS